MRKEMKTNETPRKGRRREPVQQPPVREKMRSAITTPVERSLWRQDERRRWRQTALTGLAPGD
jgi:hypothetical protein